MHLRTFPLLVFEFMKKFPFVPASIGLITALSLNLYAQPDRNKSIPKDNNKPQKCIMVFGAHADDVDEIAGGTFAKYIAMGYKGIYVSVTNNLAGCNIERTPYFAGPKFTMSDSPYKYPVQECLHLISANGLLVPLFHSSGPSRFYLKGSGFPG